MRSGRSSRVLSRTSPEKWDPMLWVVSAYRIGGTEGLAGLSWLTRSESRWSTTQPAKPIFNALSPQPYGASPYPASAAPQLRSVQSILPAPQFSNILPLAEEDTEPIRAWRSNQAEEIKKRDDSDRVRRDEMANKAEKSIDSFYEEYNKMKERSIRENKWVAARVMWWGDADGCREKEAAYLEKMGEGIAKGTAWERITELIGLENSRESFIRSSLLSLSIFHVRDLLPSLRLPRASVHGHWAHLLLRSKSTSKAWVSADFSRRIKDYPSLSTRWIRPWPNEGDPARIAARRGQSAGCGGLLMRKGMSGFRWRWRQWVAVLGKGYEMGWRRKWRDTEVPGEYESARR